MQAGLRLSGTKSRKRRACPCPSNIRNHVGRTSSVRYEVTQKESLSSSVRYEESSKRDSVRPLQNHARGHVLIWQVCRIKQAGLRLSGTKSHKGSFSMSVRYEQSSMQDFVHLVRILMKLKLVLIRPVPGITWEGLRPFGTKSRKMRACPCHSGTRNQASGTSYVWFKVARKESMSSSYWYEV